MRHNGKSLIFICIVFVEGLPGLSVRVCENPNMGQLNKLAVGGTMPAQMKTFDFFFIFEWRRASNLVWKRV